MKQRALIAAVAYLGVILYLSLAPWHLMSTPSVPWLQWDFSASMRRELLDSVLNVGFYMPLGVALSCLFTRRGTAILAPMLIGGLVSFGVELTQRYLPHRDPSYVDLCTNTAGSLIGAVIGWSWLSHGALGRSSRRRRSWLWRLSPSGALLTALWVASQTFPFMPIFRLDRVIEAVHLITSPTFVTSEFVLGVVALFILAQVVDGAGWLLIAVAALPAQLVIVHRMLSPVEIAGAFVGVLAGGVIRERVSARGVAALLLAWLVWEELRPFHFGSAQPFIWSPFASLITGAPDVYGATILLKLFLYGGLLWSLRAANASWRASLAFPAAILVVGEFLQQYLPGRTPETTDFVLLIASALFVGAAEHSARRQREQVALRAEPSAV